MAQNQPKSKGGVVSIKNIGGIDETETQFSPGVTLLTGRNATNRTSFLQAIMAVTGSNNASLKADADEGSIKLELRDETYSRSLKRRDGRTVMEGDPYLDDPTLAELFAFLLETNECRQAVARGEDLREIIMRPIDTDEIERETQRLENKRDDIDSKLDDLDSLERRLPSLQEQITELEAKKADIEDQLAEKEEEIDNFDDDIQETKEGKREFEQKLDQLQEVRKEKERIQNQITSEHQSIEALQTEIQDLESEVEDISTVSDDQLNNIDQEIQQLHGQVEAIDRSVTELQSIIQFNEDCLEDRQHEIVEQIGEGQTRSEESLTNQLVSDSQEVVCWTCGTEVETKQIESTLDQLRSLRKEKTKEQKELEREINSLQEEKKDLEQQQRRYEQIHEDIRQAEQEIEDREANVQELEKRQKELSDNIVTLEEEVDDLQGQEHSAILEAHKEANKLEVELENIRSQISEIEGEIEDIEDQLTQRDDLEAEREEIQDQLGDLRMHVEQLQEQAIEEFNVHMEQVLDLLDYENLERIWIERTRQDVREGRRKVEKERFDLHVVRSTDSGTVYEDTISHLSESEREVTGLIFALAGYLVHEVYEQVPFMLLDSIEAIDSDRIASLIDYLEGHADFLVVALLEEDAAALNGDYQRITSI